LTGNPVSTVGRAAVEPRSSRAMTGKCVSTKRKTL
jgi:hypothetical protein